MKKACKYELLPGQSGFGDGSVMSDTQRTAEELPEPQTEMKPLVRRSFVLFTDGEQPSIDRLSIMMTVLGEMDDNERHAALAYAADYYGYGIRVK